MTTHQDAYDGEDAMDGAFDAELSALFEEAAPPAEDPVFTAHVVSQLGRTDRTRLLALGGAGATGSAVAGSQLESLISGPVAQLDGMLGQAAGFVGPEAIVTGLFAVLALSIAWVIPKGRIGVI
jgi:hypothetical protein